MESSASEALVCDTGRIDADDLDHDDDFDLDADFDPERIAECGYWRCGELFEARSTRHRYCRKACRSRQNRWQRAQDRREGRSSRQRGRPQ